MDWDKLKIFHAVAESGSFTKAATVLNLSQSAISRQIQSLENELKIHLFERHARGLVLTDNGEYLYKTAHEVTKQYGLDHFHALKLCMVFLDPFPCHQSRRIRLYY